MGVQATSPLPCTSGAAPAHDPPHLPVPPKQKSDSEATGSMLGMCWALRNMCERKEGKREEGKDGESNSLA